MHTLPFFNRIVITGYFFTLEGILHSQNKHFISNTIRELIVTVSLFIIMNMNFSE